MLQHVLFPLDGMGSSGGFPWLAEMAAAAGREYLQVGQFQVEDVAGCRPAAKLVEAISPPAGVIELLSPEQRVARSSRARALPSG